MNKYLLPLLCCLLVSSKLVFADPLEQQRGLERFDKSTKLAERSSLDIKQVHIGDNVLERAIVLREKGGNLQSIRGGTRSDKISFIFAQPYQNSSLAQRVDLYFNKFNGFIHHISSVYKLSSAYLDIAPVKVGVFNSAIEKYGEPISMDDVYALTGQQQGEVTLARFIEVLKPLPEAKEGVIEYFGKLNISRSAKITKTDNNRALFHTGFDRCLLWQLKDFSEILSLCAYPDKAANAANRGVEFNLRNFVVEQVIAKELTQQKEVSLSL